MPTIEELKRLEELSMESHNTLCSWLRHILLVTSPLLGILVSLHDTPHSNLCIRLCFALSNALLASGILCVLVALYGYSTKTVREVFQSYYHKLELQASDDHPPVPLARLVEYPKYALRCEKAAYACIGIAFLLLGTYSLLVAVLDG